MINKIKLKDKLKSWLYTLGVASFACALGVCVSVSEKYQKASAYDYNDVNGKLDFGNGSFYDYDLLSYYVLNSPLMHNEYHYVSLQFSGYDFLDNEDENNFYWNTNYVITDEFGYLNFAESLSSFDIDQNMYSIYRDTTDEIWDIEETFSQRYSNDAFVGCFCLPSYEGYQGLRNYVLSYNAPQESGNFVTALTSFMGLIGGGIVQLAQTVGAGVVSFASGLFLDSGHLSILGGIIGIFAGIALAVGITSKVYTWVSTLGN